MWYSASCQEVGAGSLRLDPNLAGGGFSCRGRWLEPEVMGRCATGTSNNKAQVRGSLVHGGQDMWLIFPAPGDGEKLGLVLLDYGAAELQQRSREATLWRASAADPLSLPPLMVEGRLLQPSSSATPSPSRGFKVIFNLQATMPRRPCCSGTACSRCTAPSGLVPGAMWLAVLRSSVMVEKELDSVAFPKILGSFVQIVRIRV
jgi:hypothetical protein